MSDEDFDPDSLLKRLRIVAISAGGCVLLVMGLYFNKFSGGLSSSAEKWGQFGDFVGGLLNPLFSMLALFALLSTFSLQVKEFRRTAQEQKTDRDAINDQLKVMQLQSFESSFFHLLNLHNELLKSIDLKGSSSEKIGRDCFPVFIRRLKSFFPSVGQALAKDQFLIAYDKFYLQNKKEIGHYFTLLFNILKFISITPNINKKFYANLVRAQLSSSEVELLFYNCATLHGAKFKLLVEEYGLLKALSNLAELEACVVDEYSKAAFGSIKSAK